ncbi:unnamed protein product [Boreogadus saida]
MASGLEAGWSGGRVASGLEAQSQGGQEAWRPSGLGPGDRVDTGLGARWPQAQRPGGIRPGSHPAPGPEHS